MTERSSSHDRDANGATALREFQLGDRVKILRSGNLRGRIVELRGNLGPEGVPIYRVRVQRTPKPTYIELRGDQIEVIPQE